MLRYETDGHGNGNFLLDVGPNPFQFCVNGDQLILRLFLSDNYATGRAAFSFHRASDATNLCPPDAGPLFDALAD